MANYFGGDGIDDAPPMHYLHGKGWKFTRGGLIEKPSADYKPSEQEWDCLWLVSDSDKRDHHRPEDDRTGALPANDKAAPHFLKRSC
jgi:hypothetical protein